MTTTPTPAERRARYRDAAERNAAEGERLARVERDDDMAIDLKHLFRGFPAWLADYRSHQEPGTAA